MPANFRQSPLFRTVLFFVCLLCIGILLITLGRRNDAITEAQYRQAGVLTADEVSISARGVSAPLNHRLVQESEMVKAGQVLLELDAEDYKIALDRLNAEYAQQESAIAAYRESIAIEEENLKLSQQSTQRSLGQHAPNPQRNGALPRSLGFPVFAGFKSNNLLKMLYLCGS